MKTKIYSLLLLFTLSYSTASAVMLKRVTATEVMFYNFSLYNYSLVGHYLTIAANYYAIADLQHDHRNSLDVPPGGYIIFQNLTIPNNSGSIGLWYPGTTFPNPVANNLVDYVQYGAAGQAFESQANTAGRWVTGQFVPLSPPFEKTTNNFSNVGSQYWGAFSGINTLNANVTTVKAYCNGADKIIIDLSPLNNIAQVKVQVSNMVGQTVLEARNDGQTVFNMNGEDLPSGVYFANVVSDGILVSSTRFVKR